MIKIGNCECVKDDNGSRFHCIYLKRSNLKKSGLDAWDFCDFHKRHICNIIKCDLSNNQKKGIK